MVVILLTSLCAVISFSETSANLQKDFQSHSAKVFFSVSREVFIVHGINLGLKPNHFINAHKTDLYQLLSRAINCWWFLKKQTKRLYHINYNYLKLLLNSAILLSVEFSWLPHRCFPVFILSLLFKASFSLFRIQTNPIVLFSKLHFSSPYRASLLLWLEHWPKHFLL